MICMKLDQSLKIPTENRLINYIKREKADYGPNCIFVGIDLNRQLLIERREHSTDYLEDSPGNYLYKYIFQSSFWVSGSIWSVFCHPDYRKTGLSYRMMLLGIEVMKDKFDVKKFKLTVSKGNFAAINLYKKLGFLEKINGRGVLLDMELNVL